MKLEVLVSTVNQDGKTLAEKMNIQTDAIIINQTSKNSFEEFTHNGFKIREYSFAERGVGLSRNNALIRTQGDICLFADDDLQYIDGYQNIIYRAFEEIPSADLILFNLTSQTSKRPEYIIENIGRVRIYNCLKYGTIRIAARTESLRRANVHFSLLFGGGARYGSGEDSLFLIECLKKGLKIYKHPGVIGTVNHDTSTWFNGYTEKYFKDKGVLYYSLSKIWAKLLCLQHVIRHDEEYKGKRSFMETYKLMLAGIKEFKGGAHGK